MWCRCSLLIGDSCDLEVAQDCVAHLLHVVELLACDNVMLCIALLPLWQIWGTIQSRLRRTESTPLTLLSLKFIFATILCLCLVHTQHISYNTGFTAASISVLHPSHVAHCLALRSYCTVIILHCDHTALPISCTFYVYHMPGHFDGPLNILAQIYWVKMSNVRP